MYIYIHTKYVNIYTFEYTQEFYLPHIQGSLKPSLCVQVFLDRLSRVISSVETRASQYLDVEENEVACFPSKIEWDLTNGPISKLLDKKDTQV